jgi:hypothetical protein
LCGEDNGLCACPACTELRTLHEALLLVHIDEGGLVGVKLALQALEVVVANALLRRLLRERDDVALLLLGGRGQVLHRPAARAGSDREAHTRTGMGLMQGQARSCLA